MSAPDNLAESQIADNPPPAPEPVVPDPNKDGFPVVGMGASAGGLEAFAEVLKHVPKDFGMAVLIVQHLDANRASILAEILAQSSPLPVVQAAEGMPLRPGHVIVIPPNIFMAVEGERIRLIPRPSGSIQPMPLDHLFRSMARELGRRSIGVVLSGGGTDGTLGLEDIKSADGLTFAQDDGSARHVSMPRSAINSGVVDYVLSPAEIAAELSRLAAHPYPMQPPVADGAEEADIRRILSLVRNASGVDFTRYKRSTITRRIRRQMAVRRIDRLADYLRFLQDDPDEAQALHQDFLIRVTQFFRDPAAFEVLQKDVFPSLLRHCSNDDPFRIWVAGCATGEEVYSIAIALMENLGDAAYETPIKILATDVSDRYLQIARAGRYIENIAMDVSPERLRRFFSRVEGHYQVTKAVRDICIFSKHDITRDPPFARLDMISCRNLLIYLDLPVQKRVLPMFHYALRTGGHLMLGPSESIGTFGDLFNTVNADQKIFIRNTAASRPIFGFDARDAHESGSRTSDAWQNHISISGSAGDIRREADRLLLNHYSPPGVLVDDEMNIVQYRGRTETFLAPAQGGASLNILRRVKEGLVDDLHAAILQARIQGIPIHRRNVRYFADGAPAEVNIQVLPLHPTTGSSQNFLVMFEEATPPPSPISPPPGAESPGSDAADPGLTVDAPRRRIFELQQELRTTRDYLQRVVEDHEATTEELKSANEEILSSNEELLSTNEELQIAKEEMQSANEELSTVNDELRHRNDEMGRVNDDLVNLFGSMSIPIVMVSRNLRIRRFTPPTERLLNLIPTDLGRPIGNIRTNLEIPDLDRRLAKVIETLMPEDVDIRDHEGHWYSMRIRPYVTLDNKIDGAVVAFVDIDAIRQGTERIRRAGEYADAIIETVWQPLVVIDPDLHLMRANAAFYRTFRIARETTQGRPLDELIVGGARTRQLLGSLRQVLPNGLMIRDREVEVIVGGAEERTIRLSAHKIDWEGSGTQMILLVMEDVTERKKEQRRAEELAREQAARIEAETANRRKDEFLALLAHELRNPLAPILNALLTLRSPGAREADYVWATGIMERQVRHMARLIDDLLDASRVMRGMIHLRKERINLMKVVNHAVETARPYIETRRHELNVQVETGPITLDVDPVRLEQVLSNLLHNAAKYSPEGSRIWFSARTEGNDVLLSVRDNGFGIAPDILPNVFDLFMQADRSLDRTQGGLGIGLTLVKTLVELHGGRVSAHSAGLGRGSEFNLRLPLADPAPAKNDRPTRASHPEASPKRILLVEDNLDSAETLARLLRMSNHEVRVVNDGETAIAEAKTYRPDVFLLDIGLPGKNGYEVADALRADPDTADAVIVALTGYGQEQDRARAIQSGFDHHIVKPVDIHQLLSAVNAPRQS